MTSNPPPWYAEGTTLSYRIWDEETKTFPGVHPWAAKKPESLTEAVQHSIDEHMLEEVDKARKGPDELVETRQEKAINDLVDQVLGEDTPDDPWEEEPTAPSYLMPYWIQEKLGLAGRSELLEPRRPDEKGHLTWEVDGISHWCGKNNWWYREPSTHLYSSIYRGAPFVVPTLPDDLIAYMGGSWEVLNLTEGNVFQLSHSDSNWSAVHEDGEWTILDHSEDRVVSWKWENGKLVVIPGAFNPYNSYRMPPEVQQAFGLKEEPPAALSNTRGDEVSWMIDGTEYWYRDDPKGSDAFFRKGWFQEPRVGTITKLRGELPAPLEVPSEPVDKPENAGPLYLMPCSVQKHFGIEGDLPAVPRDRGNTATWEVEGTRYWHTAGNNYYYCHQKSLSPGTFRDMPLKVPEIPADLLKAVVGEPGKPVRSANFDSIGWDLLLDGKQFGWNIVHDDGEWIIERHTATCMDDHKVEMWTWKDGVFHPRPWDPNVPEGIPGGPPDYRRLRRPGRRWYPPAQSRWGSGRRSAYRDGSRRRGHRCR